MLLSIYNMLLIDHNTVMCCVRNVICCVKLDNIWTAMFFSDETCLTRKRPCAKKLAVAQVSKKLNWDKQIRMTEQSKKKARQTTWWNKNFVEDEVFGQARVRTIDQLDEACTNVDDWMMLVGSHDCVISYRGFRLFFGASSRWATQ